MLPYRSWSKKHWLSIVVVDVEVDVLPQSDKSNSNRNSPVSAKYVTCRSIESPFLVLSASEASTLSISVTNFCEVDGALYMLSTVKDKSGEPDAGNLPALGVWPLGTLVGSTNAVSMKVQ